MHKKNLRKKKCSKKFKKKIVHKKKSTKKNCAQILSFKK